MINPKTIQVYSAIQKGTPALKAIREALGLNQAEFAVKLGVAVSTVSRWENGHSPVTLTIPQIIVFVGMLRDVGIELNSLKEVLGTPNAE